ncbi:MAG: hypothetical protein KGI03_00795 [Patescibacteria group bacterium]|nr:hypothetical protein [Patescibacteria group bacterium]
MRVHIGEPDDANICDWCREAILREVHVVIRGEVMYLFHPPSEKPCKRFWLERERAGVSDPALQLMPVVGVGDRRR